MNPHTIDVICAGHLCLDIIPRFLNTPGAALEALFAPGKSLQVGDVSVSTGGLVANTGLTLSKLGLKVALIAKIGNDEFGKLVLDRIIHACDISGVKICPDESSSYTIGLAPVGIDRFFLNYSGTNDTFSIDDIDFSLCSIARIFHFGYPTAMKRMYEDEGNELIELLRRAKETGITVSLDTTLPHEASDAGKVNWRSIFERVCPYVDFVVPNIEEALSMAQKEKYDTILKEHPGQDIIEFLRGDDFSELSSLFLEWGVKVVMFKAAHRGCYLRTAKKEKIAQIPSQPGDLDQWSGRELWSSSFTIDRIVSATGAGDAAVAGFLAAYLRSEPPERALRYANALGYQNLHALDAVGGITGWDETTTIVNDLSKPLLPLDPQSKGWSFSKEHTTWIGPHDKMSE